jgi:sugar/nucleoside kinase (ribokinase family)
VCADVVLVETGSVRRRRSYACGTKTCTVMTYDVLRERLAEDIALPGPTVAMHDGSVDVYYRLYRGRGATVESRADLAAFVANTDTSSLRVREETREVGGQAVNAARQLHALGTDVELFGHLDATEFDSLPFNRHSMGTPALVHVFDLDDDNLMLCEESTDLASWSYAALAAVDGAVDALESAAAICCMNWLSSQGAAEAYRTFATLDLEGTPVVVDPGDVTGCTDDEVREFVDALRVLAGTADVILSTNAAETTRVAAAAGVQTQSAPDRVLELGDALGVRAVVAHERDRAIAGTVAGAVQVPNVDAPNVRRRTGGGDRFGAALAVARALEWSWPVALAFGNACASYFVTTAETGTPAEIRSFLETATLPE